jgi:ribosomal protein S18 acetylase RimI-like enzyme
MESVIRLYHERDGSDVVRLSLRAWAPVLATERAVMGADIFERLYGDDWRPHQQRDVEDALADENTEVWVADEGDRAVGFVAVKLDVDHGMGEIWMLAVDPDYQQRGLGTALLGVATDWIREAGLHLVVIDTGGDVSHSPARRTYEKAGYRPMQIVRYFKAL